jgi:hypothetical protein
MKKLQREKEVSKLRDRVEKQYNYEYADTFNQNSFKRQEDSQKFKKADNQSGYEEYENYQPRKAKNTKSTGKTLEGSSNNSKTPLVLSASDMQKEHRSYKKADNHTK